MIFSIETQVFSIEIRPKTLNIKEILRGPLSK